MVAIKPLNAVLGHKTKRILRSGTLRTVQGGAAKVNVTINGAKVLCGESPTATATVVVIDKALTPAS